MYIDYEKPEQYFIGEPASVSTVMLGKTKRKMFPIDISIWQTVEKIQEAEIDGSLKKIQYFYTGIEISGAITDKNIIQGFTAIDAQIGIVAYLHHQVSEQVKKSGLNIYVNNYAGEEWCKVDIEEMFLGLVREN